MRNECPGCHLNLIQFPPDRIEEEADVDGHKHWRYGPYFRCVGCKTEFNLPVTPDTPQILDATADKVLRYRPKPKGEKAK